MYQSEIHLPKGVSHMEQFLAYAASNGFPMVVAAYLLVRIENKLEKLDGSIKELKDAIKYWK